MEFASEMVVKATLNKLRIAEVPTILSPDGRNRPPHLRTWRDGWRHLRFLLLYSPRWLFLYPGVLLMLASLITGVWLLPGPRTIGRVSFDDAYSALFRHGSIGWFQKPLHLLYSPRYLPSVKGYCLKTSD